MFDVFDVLHCCCCIVVVFLPRLVFADFVLLYVKTSENCGQIRINL